MVDGEIVQPGGLGLLQVLLAISYEGMRRNQLQIFEEMLHDQLQALMAIVVVEVSQQLLLSEAAIYLTEQ